MQATKETVQKRPHTALWIILCVVLLCAVGAALYFCRWAEKPLRWRRAMWPPRG